MYLSIVILAASMARGINMEAGKEAQGSCQQAGIIIEQHFK